MGEFERGIIDEEEGYWRIRWPDVVGTRMAGPALYLFGTEDQKKRFLPLMAQGEIVCWELFTEPNAGSDESNVQLRAVPDGDDYIFNGQKIFVGEACKANYLYTLARTADTKPRHKGLTLFFIPADTPGISYAPLPTLGGHMKNEVFFDNVRVSKEYLLGELNKGFYNAMLTLEFERSNTSFAASTKRQLEEFVKFCKETVLNGKPLIDDPQVRDTLARIAIESEVIRLATWRTVWRISQKEKLGQLDYDLGAFLYKIFTDRHCEAMMNIIGLYGQLMAGSKWAPLKGSLEHRWRATRSFHARGTTEILKVVLARRGLGLPR
jgi:alkylation response protein AidB-like acyl-CoA dehydrogenase